MATPTGPTPEEAQAKNEQATAPATASPAKINPGDIVQEVVNAEQAYTDAKQIEPVVQDDLKPVLAGEPAVIIGTIVAVVIAALSLLHIVDVSTSVGIVTTLAPLVVGFVSRFFVTPVKK